MSLRRFAFAAAATVAATATVIALPLASASAEDRNPSSGGFTIGLWGDMPYGPDGLKALPGVLDSINSDELTFTVFDGDIKSGSTRCDAFQYTQAASMFAHVRWATIYTPGDNEWTDCDRTKAGLYNPNERLALIRSSFFADAKSQGQDRLDVTQQPGFPENARWEHDGVTFITVNVPGTDNNYPQVDANGPIDADGKPVVPGKTVQNGDLAEYTARNAANLAWLDAGFAAAKKDGSKGVMVIQQADMFGKDTQGAAGTTGDVTVHYADTIKKLRDLTSDFAGQVALVNGDDHTFFTDNPLNLPNFTRVTTDGDTNHGWVRANVNKDAAKVFTFTQVVTP
jgi:hypothetical protein